MSVAVHTRIEKKTAGRPVRQTAAGRKPKSAEDGRLASIAVRAYFMAEQRGFIPGHELDDWLNAEQQEQGGH